MTKVAGSTRGEALAVLAAVEQGLALPAANVGPSPHGPATVEDFSREWLARRRARRIRNVTREEGIFRVHVWPDELGAMPIHQVKARHLVAWIDRLVQKGLAPRTVANSYGMMHTFFRDLVAEEILSASPAVVSRDRIPRRRDADPEWRAGAVLTRQEVETVLTSTDIPPDRRVLYALLLLTGSRVGEAVGFRWRDLDTTQTPLPRLLVARSYDGPTKTDRPRAVPVHPLLATLLDVWRRSGWVTMMGRAPGGDDLIVPSRHGVMRTRHHTRNNFLDDLARIELRPRRVHDCRRTFITLARAGGARKDILAYITHSGKGDILDSYTSMPWGPLCEAVMCLDLGIVLEEVVTSDGSTLVTRSVTKVVTSGDFVAKWWENQAKRKVKKVEAPGIETSDTGTGSGEK